MGRLNRNLYVMLNFSEWPKTPGMTSKNTTFPEGISSFAGDFVAIWIKKGRYGSIYKEMKLEMDFLTSRRLWQNICSYKCQFCTKV